MPGLKSISCGRRVLGVDVGDGDDVGVFLFRIDGDQLRADDFHTVQYDDMARRYANDPVGFSRDILGFDWEVNAVTYSPWPRAGTVDASMCPYCKTWFVPVITMDFLAQRRLVSGCNCPQPQSYTAQQYDTYFRRNTW